MKARGKSFSIGHKLNVGNKYALGSKHTEQWKKEASIRMTGRKMPSRSLEYRQNAKDRLLGKKQSAEHIKHRVEGRKGYHHSQETKDKIGLANRTEFHKTDESKLARKTVQYKNWRTTVFERDNYTCQFCLERGGKLHPHHIRPFAIFPILRFEVSNGITLCEKCHKETPTIGQGIRTLEKEFSNLLK